MRFFRNDYGAAAHPDILAAVASANSEQCVGYGADRHCDRAAAMIRRLCGAAGADVHFLVGGTQANLTAIAAFLRPHEAVIAPASGHINVHETGAVEACGHKILAVDSIDGKLAAARIRETVASCADEHMVKPRLVYISQSTEYGTLYSLDELRVMREACDDCGLLLYLDGARLAVALTANRNDATLPDIAALCDAFYIGGTKNGLLFGEAMVIVNDALKAGFRYIMKQRGAMLAKGFLLGIQFRAALENNLYFDVARQANAQAEKLRAGLAALGVGFAVDSPTNQLFPILENEMVSALKSGFEFETWDVIDTNRTAVRFVTTYRTTDGDISALLSRIEALKAGRREGQ